MFRLAAEWFRRLLLKKNKMADIFEEFLYLIKKLNQEQIDYAVCGGWRWQSTERPARLLILICSF